MNLLNTLEHNKRWLERLAVTIKISSIGVKSAFQCSAPFKSKALLVVNLLVKCCVLIFLTNQNLFA